MRSHKISSGYTTELPKRLFGDPHHSAQFLVQRCSIIIIRLFPSAKVNPDGLFSLPRIFSVPRWAEATCACRPGGVSNRHIAVIRAVSRFGCG